jgi:transcriptional regulator with XRE-family HTH domain
MSSIKKNVKIAVALRTARAAIGWNQQEFADVMGVAKSTIARIETLEVSPRADLLLQAMEVFRHAGVEVDFFNAEKLAVVVNPEALNNAELRLMNEALRRSDRKGPLTLIAEELAANKLNKAQGRSPLQEMALHAASPNRRKPKP